MSSELRMYIRHTRAANICDQGTQRWFSRRGWDWTDFLRNGRPVQDFIDTGCGIAARAVAKCREEAEEPSSGC